MVSRQRIQGAWSYITSALEPSDLAKLVDHMKSHGFEFAKRSRRSGGSSTSWQPGQTGSCSSCSRPICCECCDQPQDPQSARPHHSAFAAATGGSGTRVNRLAFVTGL